MGGTYRRDEQLNGSAHHERLFQDKLAFPYNIHSCLSDQAAVLTRLDHFHAEPRNVIMFPDMKGSLLELLHRTARKPRSGQGLLIGAALQHGPEKPA